MKDAQFVWKDACEEAFAELKKRLYTTPILRGPNWALPFHISYDALDTAIGAVLGQQEGHNPDAIYYVSKNLVLAKLNYTVIEKEFLAIFYAINIFRHYMTRYYTFVHGDHSTIRYLMNKPITNARVTRCLLILQEFDITIVDIPGKKNVVAYFLYRLTHNDDDSQFEDSFYDEHLFTVSYYSPWYANIANYLAMGILLAHLSKQEKRRIIQQSGRYF